jgi:hypothetical protein
MTSGQSRKKEKQYQATWFHGDKGIISYETITMIFEMTKQNYRFCHAVKRAFQTFLG